MTILLWMTTKAHGMNTYVVAIIPLAVFTLTGIMGKEELKLINWDVLWLAFSRPFHQQQENLLMTKRERIVKSVLAHVPQSASRLVRTFRLRHHW